MEPNKKNDVFAKKITHFELLLNYEKSKVPPFVQRKLPLLKINISK